MELHKGVGLPALDAPLGTCRQVVRCGHQAQETGSKVDGVQLHLCPARLHCSCRGHTSRPC
eukprot:8143502-Alexandrium_andersonii.AAC.1